jgi:hypothetical protein
LETDEAGRGARQRRSEHLVSICPAVLNDAEHALGNLFQRIHHAARVARESLGPQADRLNGALSDLEALLELVFDYVTPVEVELRPVAADRVADSLAANLRQFASGDVAVAAPAGGQVMADPRVLSRGFQLIGKARADELKSATGVSVSVTDDRPGERVAFEVSALTQTSATANGERSLAWEVAARLIEVQGGDLAQGAAANAVIYTITLPAAG